MAIIPWAQGMNTTESPIWVVDQYTGFNTSSDLRDGVHPNEAGDVKMANVWYPSVVRAFEAMVTDLAQRTRTQRKRDLWRDGVM